jgi:hypothetical protein
MGAILATIIIAQLTERIRRREAFDAPQCKACGYILLGLTEPRCPECGYAFDPKLLRVIGDPRQRLAEERDAEEPSEEPQPADDETA